MIEQRAGQGLLVHPYRIKVDNPKVCIQHFDAVKPGILSAGGNHILLGNGFNRHIGIETGSHQMGLELSEVSEVKNLLSLGELRKLKDPGLDLEDFVSSLGEEKKTAVSLEFFKLIIERCDESVVEKAGPAMNFLTKFKFVFTTNYDRVLYFLGRAILKERSGPERLAKGQDGFEKSSATSPFIWKKGCEQDHFHLHGAFHMFMKKGLVHKRDITEEPLIVEKLREDPKAHIAIFQSECKEAAIRENQYLHHCYRKLQTLKGAMCIIGWRCDTKDAHLAKALRESSANPIYIAIYLEPGKHSNRFGDSFDISKDKEALETIRNHRYHLKNKELVFFNINTVDYLQRQ